MDDIKKQISELHTQKGEIITNLEILQGQLKAVNQRIFELMQQPQPEKKGKIKKSEDK